ncbi:YdcF family protein [Fulvivirgaceae bacterium BMA10]|uniref:YdcF family protein n=1 Tax=Splendidivirga corallicola TaxID=3051826 RepID=A0ABT8KUE4_9BACT|nr:YdcF family protein [Fulvivirgaceae bacterium BMA10]
MNRLMELAVRILCDSRPDIKTDGVFIFGQTSDNQMSVFKTAVRLIDKNKTNKVLLLKTPAKSGYPGFEVWKNELIQMGIPQDRIEGVQMADSISLNTLTESQALIAHCKNRAYNSIAISAAPFHQIRSYMTVVTVLRELNSKLKVYSQPGFPLSWTENVKHSQGTLQGQRKDLILEEMKRIETYQKKGDLGSTDLVLDYLDTREDM